MEWPRSAWWVSCAAVSAVLLWLPASSHAYSFGPTVRQAGTEQQAFDWGTQRCDADDYPDSPARAFRDAQGRTQVITGAPVNRRMRGSSLLTAVRECPAIMASHRNADPAAYDDAEWIAATWTSDGKTIHALVHDEYRGFQVPGMCPSGTYLACWYNAVTYARSTKSGATYTHAKAPAHLVATLPYRYAADTGPYGIFEPSNVLRTQRPGDATPYYYSLVHVEDYPKVNPVQRAGVCVMRTSNVGDPTSWRAWDGTSFAATFVNPYRDAGTAGHICSPVSYPQIEKMNSSVTYSEYLGRYLLVGMSGQFDPARGEVVHGFYYATSTDLVTWSDRRLLMEAPLPWICPTGDERQIAYPSLLDPASTSRNYETTGREAMLYFTRLNAPCGGPPSQDRDLVRIPIEFLPGAA